MAAPVADLGCHLIFVLYGALGHLNALVSRRFHVLSRLWVFWHQDYLLAAVLVVLHNVFIKMHGVKHLRFICLLKH